MYKPFAVEIYRRYLKGETLQELAKKLGIPAERLEQRLRAAAAYLSRQKLAA